MTWQSENEIKDGSFRYTLDYYDQSGNRRRETLPEGTSLKSAEDLLRKYEEKNFRTARNNGFEIDTEKETYGHWNYFALVLIE